MSSLAIKDFIEVECWIPKNKIQIPYQIISYIKLILHLIINPKFIFQRLLMENQVFQTQEAIDVQTSSIWNPIELLNKCRLCRNPSQFSKIGLLFPIYFYSVLLIGGVVLLECLFSIGTILSNLSGQNCGADSYFLCRSSITNIIHNNTPDAKQIQNQTGNNYMLIISLILYFEFMVFLIKKKITYLNKNYHSESKYAIMVKHIKGSETHIYQNVVKIMEDEYFQSRGVRNPVIKYYPIIPRTRREIKNNNSGENSRDVIIQKPKITKVILVFQHPVKLRDFGNKHVQEMVDPTDIIWKNIAVLKEESRNALMILGTFAVMALCFFIILLIKQWIKQTERGENQFKVFMSNLGVATVAALFNSLEGIVIRKSARQERYSTYSKFFKIVGKRLSALFFMNMVISTFLANELILLMRGKDERLMPIDFQGMVTDFFFLFITNSYLSSIFNFFDLVYGYKLLKRLKLRYFPSKCTYTEEQKKQIMSGHPVDMGLRYANIMKSLFFTSAIFPFVPFGSFFSLIGIFISYWVDKYLLLNRYVAANKLSANFGKQMIQYSKYCVVLLSFSNLSLQIIKIDRGYKTQVPVFSYGSDFYLSIFFFVLSLVYKFYWQKIKETISPRLHKAKKNESYNQVKHLFQNTYSDHIQGVEISVI